MIQHHPTPVELDDLRLLGSGAYAPLTRSNESGSLVTLSLPDEISAEDVIELVDGVLSSRCAPRTPRRVRYGR